MIPFWVKAAYTMTTVMIVAVYACKYPLRNFLWFSDIALILTLPALWLESGLLASTLAVGVLVPELFWNIGYFFRLITGKRLSGLTDYMFDDRTPRYLRALSLFHVYLPVLLLWMTARLGYAEQALAVQTVLAWAVLPVTYWLTGPEENINGVYGPREGMQHFMHPAAYLCLLMIAFPLLVYLPTHLVLKSLFSR